MRSLHLIVGWAGVVAFLLSGQYMDRRLDHLRGMDDATRLLFRSTHIYLLFTSLLNVAVGFGLPPELIRWRRWVRLLGSALVLAGPVLTGAAFLTEPWLSGLDRPYTRPAVYGCFAGVILHGLARLRRGGAHTRIPSRNGSPS